MLEDEQHWERLIRGLREGDSVVLGEFCRDYGGALGRIADGHLARGMRRRIDPEDVVQSALRTFLRRAADGQFELAGSEDLWRLLSAITLTKVREQVRFHRRKKRAIDRELPIEGSEDVSASAFHPPAKGPTPAEAAEFVEEFQALLTALDPEEQRLVELKLLDHTNDEIARTMECSERSVRRLLKRVQVRLEALV